MNKQLISQALESHLSELVPCLTRFMISQSLEWKRFSPAGF